MPGPNGHPVYRTRLTNICTARVRVLSFGGYVLVSGRWQLRTINKGFFSADQFRAWYGLGKEPWILPGQSVEDPDNYGDGRVIWAYSCGTESGLKFIAGAERQ